MRFIKFLLPDVYVFRPTREQWECYDGFRRANYSSLKRWAFFGICSARWAKMSKENKRGKSA